MRLRRLFKSDTPQPMNLDDLIHEEVLVTYVEDDRTVKTETMTLGRPLTTEH